MTSTRAHEPHRVAWLDLATPHEADALFYSQLFGWTAVTRAQGGGKFTLFEGACGPVASAYRLPDAAVAEGVTAHWIAYVATPDVAATAARAVALGGRVLVPAQDHPGLARIAVIADPAGAIVGLWQPLAPEA